MDALVPEPDPTKNAFISRDEACPTDGHFGCHVAPVCCNGNIRHAVVTNVEKENKKTMADSFTSVGLEAEHHYDGKDGKLFTAEIAKANKKGIPKSMSALGGGVASKMEIF